MGSVIRRRRRGWLWYGYWIADLAELAVHAIVLAVDTLSDGASSA